MEGRRETSSPTPMRFWMCVLRTEDMLQVHGAVFAPCIRFTSYVVGVTTVSVLLSCLQAVYRPSTGSTLPKMHLEVREFL